MQSMLIGFKAAACMLLSNFEYVSSVISFLLSHFYKKFYLLKMIVKIFEKSK